MKQRVVAALVGITAIGTVAASIVCLMVGKPDIASCLLAFLAALVTAMYTFLAHSQLVQMRRSHQAGIRPVIVLTRWTHDKQLGAFAGAEGKNRYIQLMNVGKGLAHNVCARLLPAAEAPFLDDDGVWKTEEPIHAMTQLEIPEGAKRLIDGNLSFCSPSRWRYMYAEYEDIEGNVYYTLQSGYAIQTRPLKKRNLPKDSAFWHNDALELKGWAMHLPREIVSWAEKEKAVETRSANPDGLAESCATG